MIRLGLYSTRIGIGIFSQMVRLKNRDPDFKIGTVEATSDIEVASMNYYWDFHRDSLPGDELMSSTTDHGPCR